MIYAIAFKASDLSDKSKTSKLRLNYQRLSGVSRELIVSDRSGAWKMLIHSVKRLFTHIFRLYLQKMNALQAENLDVFQRFMNGYHVIRLSDKFWASLSCNLVIEKRLMRSLKSTGRLKRGNGIPEYQRVIRTMSLPVSSSYNHVMQDFCGMQYTTGEKHKEATTAIKTL